MNATAQLSSRLSKTLLRADRQLPTSENCMAFHRLRGGCALGGFRALYRPMAGHIVAVDVDDRKDVYRR